MDFKLFLEMNEDVVDEILSFWKRKGKGELRPETLPFNNIFGNKYRIALPAYHSKNFRWVYLLLRSWFGEGGFTINWSRNSVSYTVKITPPGSDKTIEKEEESRIGKMLEKLPVMAKKKVYGTHFAYPYIHAALQGYNDATGHDINDLVKWVSSLYSFSVPRETLEQYKKAKESSNPEIRALADKELETIKAHAKHDHYYQVNEMAKESAHPKIIVLSRHPIDILRMSDFRPGETVGRNAPNITSCHSPDREYFHCAKMEAKHGGPIAFLVDEDDMGNVDLDEDEIFEDKERDVDGVTPLARLRFRRFTSRDGQTDLMVPETHVYGSSPNYKGVNFSDKVLNWAKEAQADIVNKKWSIDDFVMRGGSYRDTGSDSSMWNRLLKYKQEAGHNAGYGMDGEEDQDPDETDSAQHWYDEMRQIFQQHRHMQHCKIDYECGGDEDGGVPIISWDGVMEVRFKKDLLSRTALKRAEEDRPVLLGFEKLKKDLFEVLKDYGLGYIEKDKAISYEWYGGHGNEFLELSFKLTDPDHPENDYDYERNPDNFRDWAHDVLHSYEQQYEKIYLLIRDWMGKQGYFKPTPSHLLNTLYDKYDSKEEEQDKDGKDIPQLPEILRGDEKYHDNWRDYHPLKHLRRDTNDPHVWHVRASITVWDLALPGDEAKYNTFLSHFRSFKEPYKQPIQIDKSPWRELDTLAKRMVQPELLKQLSFIKPNKERNRTGMWNWQDAVPQMDLSPYIRNNTRPHERDQSPEDLHHTMDLTLRVSFEVRPDATKEEARHIYQAALLFDKRYPYFEENAKRIMQKGYQEILFSQHKPWWQGQDFKMKEPIHHSPQNWPLFPHLQPRMPWQKPTDEPLPPGTKTYTQDMARDEEPPLNLGGSMLRP